MKEVLILIPAHNEEESIGKVLDALVKPPYSDLADVLVINDASTDGTAQVVSQYPVLLVNQVFNLGYGGALQTGYKYAHNNQYKYVIQMDADGQHDVCNVLHLYEALQKPDANGRLPDIVIGSRFASGSTSFHISWVKKISIRFFRRLIYRATGKHILDPTSGLQGLNYSAFSYYARFCRFDMMYPDANMIIQMLLLGFNIEEIDSVMHPRTAGVSMHSGILAPLMYMLIMPLSILTIYMRKRHDKRKKAQQALSTQQVGE